MCFYLSDIPQNLRPATEQVVSTPVQPEVTSVSSDEIVIVPPASLISEYDVLELKELCEGAQRLWGVTVLFDESNPMNSVGGIQVFASLKEKGSVLKTIPDFDTLYEDEFQPKVVYFVASEATQDELEDADESWDNVNYEVYEKYDGQVVLRHKENNDLFTKYTIQMVNFL